MNDLVNYANKHTPLQLGAWGTAIFIGSLGCELGISATSAFIARLPKKSLQETAGKIFLVALSIFKNCLDLVGGYCALLNLTLMGNYLFGYKGATIMAGMGLCLIALTVHTIVTTTLPNLSRLLKDENIEEVPA